MRHKSLLLAAASFSMLLGHPISAQELDYIPYGSSYPSPLDAREKILTAPVGNDFIFEINKLENLTGKPNKTFSPVEDAEYEMMYGHFNESFTPKDRKARDAFLQQNLPDNAIRNLTAIESANSDSAAHDLAEYTEAGKTLPQTFRTYMIGASDFGRVDLQHAASRFSEVLAMEDSPSYKLTSADKAYQAWAAFMLGRTYAKLHDAEKAQHYFALTQDMVAKGTADPLGLAVASYGEEARLALDMAGGVLGENNFNGDAPNRLPQFHEAIRLYALQQQAGSRSGYDSLHILAKDIKNVPSDFPLLMKDELARRLFLTYIRGYTGPVYDYQIHNGPAGYLKDREKFVGALLALFPAEDKDIADALAAAAIELKNISLANRYLAQKQSALATWVKAREAILQDDHEKAAALYDEAIEQRGKETNHPSIDPDDETIDRERATLTLARGKYVEAFRQFLPLRDSNNANYIATRILTIDELLQLAKKDISQPPRAFNRSDKGFTKEMEKANTAGFNVSIIRNGFAMRLMRVGRHHEALPFFDEQSIPIASQYTQWVDTAASTKDNTVKANALYQMAVLIREHGTELFGTEMSEFDKPDNTPDSNVYVTEEERERLKASRKESSLPHSYRRMAIMNAMQAAALVPHKSQAFAAILCHASNWVRPLDEDEADQMYKRYVREGAIVPWATHFGHHCPTPDFSTAKYQRVKHVYATAKGMINRHFIAFSAAGSILLLAIVGIALVRNRNGRRNHHKSGGTSEVIPIVGQDARDNR